MRIAVADLPVNGAQAPNRPNKHATWVVAYIVRTSSEGFGVQLVFLSPCLFNIAFCIAAARPSRYSTALGGERSLPHGWKLCSLKDVLLHIGNSLVNVTPASCAFACSNAPRRVGATNKSNYISPQLHSARACEQFHRTVKPTKGDKTMREKAWGQASTRDQPP